MVSQTRLIGFKRDRLECISYEGKLRYDKHYWKCACDCGNHIILSSSNVVKGPVSCGCYRAEKLLENRFDGYKHGLHKHRLYSIYHTMLQRCTNPKATRYECYGGKGIKICEEWSTFINFYNWAVDNGYDDGLSIERIESNDDYRPGNCEWITLSENTKRCNATKTRRDDGTFERRAERTNQSS